MVKETTAFLKNILTRVPGLSTTVPGDTDASAEFGEDSILQQVDPVPRCPRTGQPLNADDPVESCQLADGACSELAASGIRVACLRNPCGLLQERRAAA